MSSRSFLWAMLGSAFIMSQPATATAYVSGCGNEGQDRCGECDCVGANPINPQRGAVLREVEDIATFGQAPIAFKRYYVSRHRDFTQAKWELGAPHVWQHNWNYEIRESASSSFGLPNLIVRYPEGLEYRFKAVDATGSVRVPDAGFGDRLYPWAGNTGFTLVRPDGRELDFARIGSNKYRFDQMRVGPGTVYSLTYDTSARLIRVSNGYGRYLDISRLTFNGGSHISSVTTNDGRSATFTYGMWAPTSNAILMTVAYPDGTHADYSYAGRYGVTSGLPLLSTAQDPGFDGPGTRVHYVYNYNAVQPPPYGLTVGVVLDERNLLTDEVVVSLPLGGGEYPQVFDGNIEVTRKYAHGLLEEMADGEGRRVRIGRTANGYGYIQSLTYDNGATTSFTRDYAGRSLTETNPIGAVKSNVYDAAGYLTSSTNEQSATTTITRDAAHRPIAKLHPDGSTESWTYDAWGLPATHTLRSGGVETFVRYGQNAANGKPGDLWKHIDPLGYITTYTHDAAGNVTSITDPRGNITTYTYDSRGRRLKEIHPDNSFLEKQYDDYGNIVARTNELGQTTSIGRDEYGRVAVETDPIGGTTWYEYAGASSCASCGYRDKPTRIEDPNGHIETREYDKGGLLITQTYADSTNVATTTTYDYDAVGQLESVEDPGKGVTSYTYDLAGQQITSMDPLGRTTTYSYDAAGRLTAMIRPDGSTTQFGLNAMGQVVTEVDSLNQATTRTYNAAGQLVAMQNAKGQVYEFVRDLLGRVTKLRYPDASEEHFGFDPAGNRTSYTTRTGDVMTCSFDTRNRETSCKFASEATGVNHAYDAASRITGVTNENASISHTHDAQGRITSTTYAVNGASTRTIAYSYDAVGKLISTTYPSGKKVLYDRDAQGRVVGISIDNVAVVHYGYDAQHRRTSELFANGWTTNRTYDTAGQATSIVHATGLKNNPSFTYGYDQAGRRTHAQYADGKRDVYGYDATGQLMTVEYGVASNGTFNQHAEYTYDAVGNRVSLWVGTNSTFYTTNNLNQVVAANASAIQYDGRGNLVAQAGLTLGYDVRDRLTNTLASSSKKSVVSLYDGENRAIVRNYGGQTTYRIFDEEWNLVEEWDAQGGLVASYVYAPGMDSIVARISSQGTLYYHRDALGSVTHLSDASGAVVERYTYDAYGAPTVITPSGLTQTMSAVGNSFLFTGREWLATGQVYDYRRRAYLPQLGRFAQVDPLRFAADDVNLYRYVGNGPIDRVDPRGEFWWLPPIIVVCIIMWPQTANPPPEFPPPPPPPPTNPPPPPPDPPPPDEPNRPPAGPPQPN